MTTAQIYKNLGKFVEADEKKIGQGTKIVIRYTQPNYQDPKKIWEMGQFEDKISDELVDKIAELKKGQEICVHTIKNASGYADLHDISGPEDVPQKKESNSYQKKGNNWQPKDETGIAVGGAWTNAMDLTRMRNSREEMNLDNIEALAWDILQRKLAQEAKLRASKEKNKPKNESIQEEKPMSKLEQRKAKQKVNKEEEENNKQVPWDNDEEEKELDDIEF